MTEYNKNISTPDVVNLRDQCIENVKRWLQSLRNVYGNYQVLVSGSAENSLFDEESDIDLIFVFPEAMDADPIEILKQMTYRLNNYTENIEWIYRAWIPLIKFTESITGLNVDISVNNPIASYNTRTILTYC